MLAGQFTAAVDLPCEIEQPAGNLFAPGQGGKDLVGSDQHPNEEGETIIRASLVAHCAPQPKTHPLSAWLEREIQNGVWQPEATLFDHRVPAASDARYDILFDGCISGRWRARRSGVGLP